MDSNRPSMFKATVIGGAAAAVLSSVPFVNCLNIACCSLLIGGGFLASFLYSREVAAAGGSFTVGMGTIAGLVSGLYYAAASSLIGWFFALVTNTTIEDQIIAAREAMERVGAASPEMLDALDQAEAFFTDAGVFLLAILGFFFSLAIGAVFCTIGGLIGGAVFRVEPKVEPPAPPQPPAPPAPPAEG